MKDILDLQSEYNNMSNLYCQIEIEFGNWSNEELIQLEKVYKQKDELLAREKNLLIQQSSLNSQINNYLIRQNELEKEVNQARRDHERLKDEENQFKTWCWIPGYGIYLATKVQQFYDNYNSKQNQRNDNYRELSNITINLSSAQNDLNEINNRVIELTDQLVSIENNMDIINVQKNFFNSSVSTLHGISLKLNDIKNDLSNNQLDNIPKIIKNLNVVLNQTKEQHEKDQKQAESFRSKLKGNYEYRITAILNQLNQ